MRPSHDVEIDHPSLEMVLKHAPMGDTILSHFETNKKLLPSMRRKLQQAIAEYYVERGWKSLPSDVLKNIAQQIVTKFHGEVEVSVVAIYLYSFLLAYVPNIFLSYLHSFNSFRKIM